MLEVTCIPKLSATSIRTICLLGGIQGAILSIVVFFKRQNSIPNAIFAILLLLFSMDIGSQYINSTDFVRKHHSLYGWNLSFTFLYSPVLYMYVRTVTGQIKHFKRTLILHCAPVIIGFTIICFGYYLKSDSDKLMILDTFPRTIPVTDSIWYNALLLSTVCTYHILIILTLREYSRKVSDYYSDISRARIKWLKITVAISISIWTISFILNFTLTYIPFLTVILFTAAIYIFTIYVISMPEVFILNNEMTAKLSAHSDQKINYDDWNTTYRTFHSYIENNKSYLDPEVTIADVCEKTDIPVYRISKILNEKVRKNFYMFINEFRVENARKKLDNRAFDSQSVLSIGFDSGFNSKSTFNDVFKKIAGITPSEYRKISKTSQRSE